MTPPRLLVLGSAASEGIPAYFCGCRVCRAAAKLGGPDIRARVSYNFGGDVQIDFGPDMMRAWHAHPDILSRMRHVLVTHAHEDHLSPLELLFHSRAYAPVPLLDAVLQIHGTAPTRERMVREFALREGETFEQRLAAADLAFHLFQPFDSFALPGCDAFVRTFAADHVAHLDPCVFLVTLRGRTVFIGNDTGFLPDASWEALAKLRGQTAIDVAVLDDTGELYGVPESPKEGDPWLHNHMSAPAVLETFDRLAALGLLAPACIRAVNHFSHNAGATHDDLRAFFEPRGIVVCHDGLSL